MWLLGFNKVDLSGTSVCRVSIMGTCDTRKIYDKSKNLLMVLVIAYEIVYHDLPLKSHQMWTKLKYTAYSDHIFYFSPMTLQERERVVACLLSINLILQPVHPGAAGYFPSSLCGMEIVASSYLESIP